MKRSLSVLLTADLLFAPICFADCQADAAWVQNPVRPTNAEPPKGDECAFYKLSWQYFLWLTDIDATTTQPRFLGFTTPQELFTPSSGPKDFGGATRFSATLRSVTTSKTGKIMKLGMAPRLSKMQNTAVGGDEINQALDLGALVDQNGRVVYYAQHVDAVFADYIRAKGFDNASTLANAKPDDVFPPGSIELKSSWRVKSANESEEGFIAIDAEVPTLVTSSEGRVQAHPEIPRNERMLLVGLHVVVVTEGHPEFILATFEHKRNAPDLPKEMQTGSNLPVSQENYTFYKANTPAVNCNEPNNLIAGSSKLTLVDAQKQILAPVTQVFRQFLFGGEDKPNDELIPLNDSVHALLPPDSKIKSYDLIGALWMEVPKDTFLPGKRFGRIVNDDSDEDVFGGERKLSNSTMETFTQSEMHCFSCHDTRSEKIAPVNGVKFEIFPETLLGVSHILRTEYAKHPKPAAP